MADLSGRAALVTGAGSGIGRAAAQRLCEAGADVFATDIDADGLAQTKAMATNWGGRLETALQDVTDEARWDSVFDEAKAALDPISILVNNAGVALAGGIEDYALEDWRKQMAINVDSVFLGTRAAMRRMKGLETASIINISSVAGLRGAAGASAYCTSKGAVRLFTKASAVECAQLGYKIRVNSIHPGIIDTPIWTKNITRMAEVMDAEQAAELTAQSGANTMDVDAIAMGAAPMTRAGQPEEIGDAIVFLASDASSYITGQEIVIDGGMTARS
ncbi:MAG: SDR family oxidoreductase [Pseudomonadota bacterium]